MKLNLFNQNSQRFGKLEINNQELLSALCLAVYILYAGEYVNNLRDIRMKHVKSIDVE